MRSESASVAFTSCSKLPSRRCAVAMSPSARAARKRWIMSTPISSNCSKREPGRGGNHEPKNHSCDGGVNSRPQNRNPEAASKHHIHDGSRVMPMRRRPNMTSKKKIPTNKACTRNVPV